MDAKLWISNILIALLLIIIAPNGHILANIAIASQLSLAIDLSSKGLPGQLRSFSISAGPAATRQGGLPARRGAVAVPAGGSGGSRQLRRDRPLRDQEARASAPVPAVRRGNTIA